MPRNAPLSIFCSYSHKDEKLRKEVQIRLKSLQDDGVVREVWDDRCITAGQEWKGEISSHLKTADLILLLVTPDFVASDYCMDVELTCAMDRHEARDACVVPIILRKSDWQTKQFGKLQALPIDGIPVRRHPKGPDQAFWEISQGLRNTIRTLTSVNANVGANRPDPRNTILADLCNRAKQDEQLKNAWEEHRAKKWRRPFVSIIHGPAEEDHAGYMQRLLDYTFPDILGMSKGSRITLCHRISWPGDCWDRQCVIRGLTQSFSPILKGLTDLGSITKQISLPGQPGIVYCELLSSYPNYGHREALDAFLEFWNNWPDLAFGQALLVLLSVTYQPGYRSASVEQLFGISDKFSNLSMIVTDELPPVRREDVYKWRAHEEVKKFCDLDRNLAAWDADIDNTFRDRDHIPMEQLVGTLNRMLTVYQRR